MQIEVRCASIRLTFKYRTLACIYMILHLICFAKRFRYFSVLAREVLSTSAQL